MSDTRSMYDEGTGDIQYPRPLIHEDSPGREHLELVSLTMTDEPRGNGNESAKGVFYDARFRVVTPDGGNNGYEFTQRVYADARIGKNDDGTPKKASVWFSRGRPFLNGLVAATKGQKAIGSFWTVCKGGGLKAYVDRALTLTGQRFKASVGVEKGDLIDKNDKDGGRYRDKQIVKGFYALTA